MAENPDKEKQLLGLRQEIQRILDDNADLKDLIFKNQNNNDFLLSALNAIGLDNLNKQKLNSSDSEDENPTQTADDEDNPQNSGENNFSDKISSFSNMAANFDERFSKLPPELQKSIQKTIDSSMAPSNDENTNQNQIQNQSIQQQQENQSQQQENQSQQQENQPQQQENQPQQQENQPQQQQNIYSQPLSQQETQENESQETNEQNFNSLHNEDDEDQPPQIEVNIFPRTFPRRWNINTVNILHPNNNSQYKPFRIPVFESEDEDEDNIKDNSTSGEIGEKDKSLNNSENAIQKQTKNSKNYTRIDPSSLHFDGLPPGVHSDLRSSSPIASTSSTITQKFNEDQVSTPKPINNIFNKNPSLFDNSTMKEQMDMMLKRLDIKKKKYDDNENIEDPVTQPAGNQIYPNPPIQSNNQIQPKDTAQLVTQNMPNRQIQSSPQNQSNLQVQKKVTNLNSTDSSGPIDPIMIPNYFQSPNHEIILPNFTNEEPKLQNNSFFESPPGLPDSDTEVQILETPQQQQPQPQKQNSQQQTSNPQKQNSHQKTSNPQKQNSQQQAPLFHSDQMNAVADRFISTLNQKFGQQISNDRYAQLIAQFNLQQHKLQSQNQTQNQAQNQTQPQTQPSQTQNQPQTQHQQQQQQTQQTQQQQPQPQQQQQQIQPQSQPSQLPVQQQPNSQVPVQQVQVQPFVQMQPLQHHFVAYQPVMTQFVAMHPVANAFVAYQPMPQQFVAMQQSPPQPLKSQPPQQQPQPPPQPQQPQPQQQQQQQTQPQQQQQTSSTQAQSAPQAVARLISAVQSHLQGRSPSPEPSLADQQRLKLLELEKARHEYSMRVQNQNKQLERLINVEKFTTDTLNNQTSMLFGEEGKFKEKLKNDSEEAASLFKRNSTDFSKFFKQNQTKERKEVKPIELRGVLENGELTNSQSSYNDSDDQSILFFENDQDD